jgi:hypothetical protein
MTWRDLRARELERYRVLGWPLFPVCARSKIPACACGFKDATRNPLAWKAWFDRDNEDGIGLPTGVASGIGVIDIDPRNGGEASLAKIIAEHGPLPGSAVSLTGGDGRHLLFSVDTPARPFKLAPGIDVKLDGGYIVAPPSIHPSGKIYGWAPGLAPDEVSIAPLPSWCHKPNGAANGKTGTETQGPRVEVRYAADPKNAASRYFVGVAGRLRDGLRVAPVGERNDTLNRAAFVIAQLADLGGPNVDWAIECLRAAAGAAGLDEREIERTLRSGFEAGEGSPRHVEFKQRGKQDE